MDNLLNKHDGKMLAFDFADQKRAIASIRVVGVGGAGGNAINRMIEDEVSGVEFYTLNTDLQALDQNKAPYRIQIGKNLTKGLGAGGNPEIGRKAMEENKDLLIESLSDSDMVFITCGMGGGTGTGAAPVVAEIARDLGALTVGIVTKPFIFEGGMRADKAEKGIAELREFVDTLIIVPNQKLLSLVPKHLPLGEAFKMADRVLMHATKGISDVINVPGLINVDFADVKTVMSQMGDALMGSGTASGDGRAQEAAEEAISSPLIEDVSINGAMGVLVNISGGRDMSLNDVSEATTIIHEAAGNNANIIFGAVIDEKLEDQLRVTVIATGFSKYHSQRAVNRQEPERRPKSNFGRLNEDLSVFQKFDKEPIEQALDEIFGPENGMGIKSKDDPNIPAYLRKGREI